MNPSGCGQPAISYTVHKKKRQNVLDLSAGLTPDGWRRVYTTSPPVLSPGGTGDRQPSDPSRSTRPCVPPTRFGPSCDTDPPNSSFLVWRHQTWLTVGTHPEVLMPRVDDHLVQPRCRDDGLGSHLMSAQRGNPVRRSAGTGI